MREAVRHDITLRLLLQRSSPIAAAVSSAASTSPGSINFHAASDRVGPDAGEAVGLQFDLHLQRFASALLPARCCSLHLRQNAEQVLHVMADLVRDHIGLGNSQALPVHPLKRVSISWKNEVSR